MKRPLILFVVITGLFSCGKNCHNIDCEPCAPYASNGKELVEFDTTMQNGFGVIKMDTIYLHRFDKNMVLVDSFVWTHNKPPLQVSYSWNTLQAMNFGDMSHLDPKIIYYRLSITGCPRKFIFRDFHTTYDPGDPDVCCNCGESEFISVNINDTTYQAGELPYKIHR